MSNESNEWDKKHKIAMRLKRLSEAGSCKGSRNSTWIPLNNREDYLSRVSEEEEKKELVRAAKKQLSEKRLKRVDRKDRLTKTKPKMSQLQEKLARLYLRIKRKYVYPEETNLIVK